MCLSAILERAGLDAGGAADAPVTGFAIDHRKVAPGTVFGAFQGAIDSTTPAGSRMAMAMQPGLSDGMTSPPIWVVRLAASRTIELDSMMLKRAQPSVAPISDIIASTKSSARASSAGMEPKPMIAPRVSKHEKSGKYESGANGQSEGRASSRLTRPKFADERTFTRRRKFPVLFYSKEMEPLARKVADASDQMVELGQIDWRTFPDGFPDLFINDAYDVRDRHVAFLGSFHSPEVIFEQLSIIYSLPKMFVASFTLVLPFFPTGTAERVVREGEVATAVTLARILSNIPPSRGGPTSTIIFDIHALQERFYFGDSILPCFESGIPLLIERLNTLEDADNVVIAYPDEGAYKRFHSFFS